MMSSKRVAGRFAASATSARRCRCVTKRNRSVPAKTTFALPGIFGDTSHRRVGRQTGGHRFHVLPKSARARDVRREIARAVRVERDIRRAARRARTRRFARHSAVRDAGATRDRARSVSRHVAPPSCETCTLPSSVPTQSTFGSSGDSAIGRDLAESRFAVVARRS